MDEKYYLNRLKTATSKYDELKLRSNKISNFRLIAFVLFFISFIIFLINNNYLFLASSILFVSLFIVLIIYHNKLSNNINYYKLLIETLTEYIARFNNDWINFKHTGLEFNSNNLPFLLDLDILGEASLYKYLNICITRKAKEKLVFRLSNPNYPKEELISKQNSMQEISKNIDFSLNFQVALKDYQNQVNNINLNYIAKNMQNKLEFSPLNIYIGFLFTFLAFSTLILAMVGKLSFTYFSVIFLIQLLYSIIYHSKYKNVFKQITDLSLTIVFLNNIYKVINSENFEDKTLKNLQTEINNYGLVGINEINKLKDLESFNKFFLTYIIFNGMFSMNLLIINYYKKFIDKYGVNFYKSIEALEEFEVYTSLAILGQTKKTFTLPSLVDQIKINFTNLKHPLISEKECIPNNFLQEANINIITGSNMSGKTSFMRTIGINLILMNAGAYCNADSFSSPYLKLFTSMRISDDISKGISTFYAELLRVKTAIEYSKTNKPMIILIDEIFKGTNSNDRIQGAISLIEKLSKDYIIVFISTHDFELCEIKSVNISNYHFSEYYEENKIKFNYKLQIGKCRTTNAKYLMKIAGIID